MVGWGNVGSTAWGVRRKLCSVEFWSVVVRGEGARSGRVSLWFPQVISTR